MKLPMNMYLCVLAALTATGAQAQTINSGYRRDLFKEDHMRSLEKSLPPPTP